MEVRPCRVSATVWNSHSGKGYLHPVLNIEDCAPIDAPREWAMKPRSTKP